MRPLEWHVARLERNPYVWPPGTDRAAVGAAGQRVRRWASAAIGRLDEAHPTERLNRYLCWERTG